MSARPVPARHVLAPPAAVASMGRRFAAGLLDGLLLVVTAVPLAIAWGERDSSRDVLLATGAVLVTALAVLQWVWHGTRGWTLGRLALGLRTVDVETLLPVGLGRVLLRGLVVVAGLLVLVVGAVVVLVSPLFDATGRNRGWHDKAARDEVVDLRAREPEAPAWFDAPQEGIAAPAPALRAAAVPSRLPTPADGAAVPPWVTGAPASSTVTGSQPLVLAPLGPREHGPDVDTRTMPVVRVAAPRALPSVSAAPTLEPVSTELDPDVEMTRRAAPRPLPDEPAPVEETSTTAELALSDGRRVVVDGVALVGRNPAAAVDVQIVRVVDPGRSVSKTHLQVAVSPSGVWVADRGSTNGTVVTLPDGGQVVCPVDHPVRLRPGATVRFGDCSFVVVRGPETSAT